MTKVRATAWVGQTLFKGPWEEVDESEVNGVWHAKHRSATKLWSGIRRSAIPGHEVKTEG